MAGMRVEVTTDDYRNTLSGEGGFDSLGYEWADGPHCLSYNLCVQVDNLRSEVEAWHERVRVAGFDSKDIVVYG